MLSSYCWWKSTLILLSTSVECAIPRGDSSLSCRRLAARLPHLAPVGVLSALGRVSIFITLQPESKPIQIPLVSGQLVPGLELLVGFVRKDIKIGPMITYQRDRVIQGMDILLLRHLHQDRGFEIGRASCRERVCQYV